jgi:hypothetical protein
MLALVPERSVIMSMAEPRRAQRMITESSRCPRGGQSTAGFRSCRCHRVSADVAVTVRNGSAGGGMHDFADVHALAGRVLWDEASCWSWSRCLAGGLESRRGSGTRVIRASRRGGQVPR